jgi:hypothetical protein
VNYGQATTLAQAGGFGAGAGGADAQVTKPGSGRKSASDSGEGIVGGGVDGGGSDTPAPKGGDQLDSMLSQLLGGPQAGDGGGGFGGGSDVVLLPPKPAASTKNPNLFEFASWRYKKAAHEEGRVRLKSFLRSAGATAVGSVGATVAASLKR